MLVRYLPLLLLALMLCVTGCRESLVDVPPDSAEETPPTDPEEQEANVRGIYVKGEYSLSVGDTRSYRAESLPEAVRYEWTLRGESTGTIVGTPTDVLERLYDLTGADPGTAYLRVAALDAQNREIGLGQIVIQIVP
ncbi:MAG: hypothetical protein AAGI91_02700 [Bacteroidota bacterium]